MRLAAVFVKDHHFLFNHPQMINLGGKYIYKFDNAILSREINHDFIENFFDESLTITLVSAIVGSNGAGKTTVLKEIIEEINIEEYHIDSSLIFEVNDEVYTFKKSFTSESFSINKLETSVGSIFYSPFLDFKQFIYGIDISYDNIIQEDLKNIENIYQESTNVNPYRNLRKKNWSRQFDFINSKYSKILKEAFGFPEPEYNKLTFTRHRLDMSNKDNEIRFNNTPYNFRSFLQEIFEKIRAEASFINSNRPKDYNTIVLQKDLLKNYILMDFLSLFIVQMEKENRYLSEGFFDLSQNDIKQAFKNFNANSLFYYFIEHHYFKLNEQTFKLLPLNETKELLNSLFLIIDDLQILDSHNHPLFDWNDKSIFVSKEVAWQIMQLQSNFLTQIDRYYGSTSTKEGESIFTVRDRIEEIVNFEPSQRSLSSGESALLNMYSRIYSYFKKYIIDIPVKNKANFYIILLDEADLGFHPSWKKKFLKQILIFFKDFFDNLQVKAQIIFTTHDSLTLSDMPNNNIVYLTKENEYTRVLIKNERPQKSFGANITDLLADSFFVQDGLIGDFAKEKIEATIAWINDNKVLENRNIELFESEIKYHKKIISLIDEKIIRIKLSEMIDELTDKKELQKELIQQEIDFLIKKRDSL